ncbi:MAG: GTP cyclohydrolase I FolE [Streptosporangiaceae bacterium]
MTEITDYPDLENGVAGPQERFDLAAAAVAAREFLAALGISCDSPGMWDSPHRMAAAYAEMFTARSFELTTFPNDAGYDDLVVVRSIPVRSVCEHHLLPFLGHATVGYRPADRILGLSKIARVVEMFARRPQVQERLTQQIASWLDLQLAPKGVGVVIEAEHTCMTVRGVQASGSVTTTTALSGVLRDDLRSRAEFFASVRGSTPFS